MPRNALSPVRFLKDDEAVKVYYLDTAQAIQLDPTRPVEALAVGHNDDATFVECMDPTMLAVRQVDEFGEAQTVMLSPRMAVELSRIIDSFVVLGPTGREWTDGRLLID